MQLKKTKTTIDGKNGAIIPPIRALIEEVPMATLRTLVGNSSLE